MDRKSFYSSITNSIIELIKEKNTLPWYKSWDDKKADINSAAYSILPYNPVTGTIYRGMNYMTTKYLTNHNVQEDPRFLTFNNIKDCGFSLKKGSKSIPIYFIAPVEKKKKATTGNEGTITDDEKEIGFAYKKYAVFHASCVEGIPTYIQPEEFKINSSGKELIEQLIDKAPISVYSGGNRAFYRPSDDLIQMPEISQFKNENSFYSTLLHEIGHWTMSKDRVPRQDDFTNNPQSSQKQKYAAEELVAELFSVTASPFFNVKPEMNKAAEYIRGWITHLENDEKFIYRASAYAERATEFCLNVIGIDKVQSIKPQIEKVKFHIKDLKFPFYGKTKSELTPYIDDLLSGKKTEIIKDLQKNSNKPFNAALKLSKGKDKIQVQFFFEKKKTRSKSVKR